MRRFPFIVTFTLFHAALPSEITVASSVSMVLACFFNSLNFLYLFNIILFYYLGKVILAFYVLCLTDDGFESIGGGAFCPD